MCDSNQIFLHGYVAICLHIGTSEIQLDRLPPPLTIPPPTHFSSLPPPILHHLHPLPFTHNNGHKITEHLSQGVNQVLTTGVNQVLTTGVNQVLDLESYILLFLCLSRYGLTAATGGI